MHKRTIGILTSGGDAPGMNVAVRAVVRTAIENGFKVMGIRRGYQGLINDDIFEMDLRSVSGMLQRGGTILFSARCPQFLEEEYRLKAVENCKKYNIDGLVVIGGDGTFRGAGELTKLGVACIGIPATIDNDIGSTEYSIGFDTAVNTATEMIDRLRDTTQSHDRCSVVEVMGRHSGQLALYTGVACGATSILIPEIEFTIEKNVVNRIKESLSKRKKHFIIVVAEGVGEAAKIARIVEEETGIESRATILGHVQRGGSPTASERIIASRMGHKSVMLLKEGKAGRVVVYNDNLVSDMPIEEALTMKREIDIELYRIAEEISI